VNKEKNKERREITIFREFARKSEVGIEPASVSSCRPPEPDIICAVRGKGCVRFELTEACAPEFAQAINNPNPEGVYSCWSSDVSEDTLRKKLSKSYPVPEPVELLIFTDGATAKPDSQLIREFREILKESQGQFRRVWLMGDEIHQLWPETS